MATIYARWIKMGRITIDDVPEFWKEKVKELLNS